jgi:iron complex transport system substrate-binding protein
LVEKKVIVEIKSIDKLAPVHTKQLLTYLRLTDLRVGLLVNFGGATIKEGIRRLVNGYIPQTLASREAPYLRAKPPEPKLIQESKD